MIMIALFFPFLTCPKTSFDRPEADNGATLISEPVPENIQDPLEKEKLVCEKEVRF
jgi:hypothetical protein